MKLTKVKINIQSHLLPQRRYWKKKRKGRLCEIQFPSSSPSPWKRDFLIDANARPMKNCFIWDFLSLGSYLTSFSMNWDKDMHFQLYFFLTLFWTWHVSLICLLRLSFQASVRGIFPLFFFILSMKRSKKCNKDSLKLFQKLSLPDNWVILMQLSEQVTTLFS